MLCFLAGIIVAELTAYKFYQSYLNGLHNKPLKNTNNYNLEKLAYSGHTYAQYKLAKIYYENQNYPKTLEFLEYAASGGHPYAQKFLGDVYKNGFLYAEQDLEIANYWYAKAMDNGIEPAALILAQHYYFNKESRDYQKAYEIFLPLAENDNAESQYYLSRIFARGLLDKADHDMAFYWAKRSAANNYPLADYRLGDIYRLGRVTDKDFHLAYKHTKIAAEADIKGAQYDLALHYEHGLGTNADYELAAKWYKLSEKNGYKLASNIEQYYHDDCLNALIKPTFYLHSFPTQCAISMEWGSTNAKLAIADFYLYYSEDKDPNTAEKLYINAAKEGNSIAYYKMMKLKNQKKNSHIETLAWAYAALSFQDPYIEISRPLKQDEMKEETHDVIKKVSTMINEVELERAKTLASQLIQGIKK